MLLLVEQWAIILNNFISGLVCIINKKIIDYDEIRKKFAAMEEIKFTKFVIRSKSCYMITLLLRHIKLSQYFTCKNSKFVSKIWYFLILHNITKYSYR